MVIRGRDRSVDRGRLVTVVVMVVGAMTLGLIAACGASVGPTAGSAQRGPSVGPGGDSAAGSAAFGTSSSVTTTRSAEQGTGGSASGSAPPGPSAVPGVPAAGTTSDAGVRWTADVLLTGGRDTIVSPTGDLLAVVDRRGVCLHAGRPDDTGSTTGPDSGTGTGVGQCVLAFAAGVVPAFAVFSPTGGHLLVVAGPAARSEVYVLDSRSWRVQVIGPQGLAPIGSSPPTWDLSSAAWDNDGAAVLLLPRTAEPTGPVLGVELTGGAPYERVRLAAGLLNSSPSVWSTRAGLALVANAGAERNRLWWADFASGAVHTVAAADDPDGSLALSAADPLGRTALVCPRRADGALGATIGVAVADRRSAALRPGSGGCAGAVFSADGEYLALADQLSAGYGVLIVATATGATVLSVPLPVPIPAAPPYLTWAGDVVVVSDVTGQWPMSAAVLRIAR